VVAVSACAAAWLTAGLDHEPVPRRVVLNKDYVREHMLLITSGMGDVSEEVIDTVARHDADATSSYTAHAVEEVDISALLAEDEKVVAQLPISAFFGFPSKDEGEDVKGDCVLALTQSSDGHKRLLFVYTGIVQRTLKGSEKFDYVKPCITVCCFPSASSTFSADYTMGRQQDSGFRIITVADQLVDIYSSESTEMNLHKKSGGATRVPTKKDCCNCISSLKYWCGFGPCMDLCALKPCFKMCGQKSCCEPETKNKSFSVDLSELNLDIQDMITKTESLSGQFNDAQWKIETKAQSLSSVIMHWVDPRTNQLRETTAIVNDASRSEIAQFVSKANWARFRESRCRIIPDTIVAC
jgi:hypothetical protein